MDFRNMRTSMESVTGLFETLRSLHKELEIITMDHNTNPTTVIFIFILIAQETLDTLRSLHRELELEDGAEEPEEQVLSSNIFLRSDRSFQLSGLLSNDFQVPWQEVLRGPDAIDLWLDRIVRWFNTFLSNTNILTWNLNWSTCRALFALAMKTYFCYYLVLDSIACCTNSPNIVAWQDYDAKTRDWKLSSFLLKTATSAHHQ